MAKTMLSEIEPIITRRMSVKDQPPGIYGLDMVPTFLDWQNSLTFEIFFSHVSSFFKMFFFKQKTWSIQQIIESLFKYI